MIALMTLPDTPEENEKFIQLYERYKNLVMWIAQKKVGDKQIAEDCVQDTFMYVARHFETVGEIEDVHTKNYLATIANGIAISHYRRRHRENPLSYFNEKGEAPAPESLSDFDMYESLELSFAMDKLEEDVQGMLQLKYVYGLSSKDIGKIFGISDALVRKKIQLAIQKLRTWMQ